MERSYEIHIGKMAYPVHKVIYEIYHDQKNTIQVLQRDLISAREILSQEDEEYMKLRDYAQELERKLGIESECEK